MAEADASATCFLEDPRQVAQILASGQFQIAVLSSQQDRVQKQVTRIQEQLDLARAPPSNQEEQGGGLLSSVWGSSNDDPSARAHSGVSRREIDRMKKDKLACEMLASEIERKIARIDRSLTEAREFVRRQMGEPVTTSSETRNQTKAAILDIAFKVAPMASDCALTLGKLSLRTPAFFHDNNLISSHPSGTGTGAETRRRLLLAAVDLDLQKADTCDLYEEIDALVEAAAMQEADAIEQLLSLLVEDKLQEPGMQIQLREHLMRCVMDKAAALVPHDQERSMETGFKCAMCSNWPRPVGSEPAPNSIAYQDIVRALEKQMQNEHDEDDRSSVCSSRRGSVADPPSRPNALKDALLGKRASEAASRSYGRRPSQGGLGGLRPAKTASKDKDPLEKMLKAMESNFNEAMSKDKLLHLTPQVVEALIRIGSSGMDRFHHEELVLFGCPSLPEVQWEKPHWFLRRKAALRVCEMAQDGNVLAAEMICRKLLVEDEHWMVRSIVVEEVCRMLGRMTPESPFFRELLDELAKVLFTLPMVSKERSRDMQKQALLAQQLTNVQRSAEKTFTRELPRYPHKLQAAVVADLTGRVQSHEAEGKRQIMGRILRATGGVGAYR